MTQSIFLLIVCSCFFSANSLALSVEANQGKALFPSCHICHNPELDPPLGPPMWGVQRRYKNNSIDAADFVQSMVSFVKAPTLETAIHGEAVEQLGLMPALPLPDEMLSNIAQYIFEEQFAPPCAHWEIAVKRATQKGDAQHAKKDQFMLNRFCK
jgi:mono/diheme cytochrome c family protein